MREKFPEKKKIPGGGLHENFTVLFLPNLLRGGKVYGIMYEEKSGIDEEDMAKRKYLECGKAVSTHGVRGTLRFESWCDTPGTLAALKVLYKKGPDGAFVPMKVRSASVQKSMVLVSFEELTSLEQAIPFKGTVFYADRDSIRREEGDVFVADLIGLPVLDMESGEKYGILSEVISPGGRDVYVVDDVRGGQFMIPAVAEFIREVVTEGEGEGIYVSLIEGMRE